MIALALLLQANAMGSFPAIFGGPPASLKQLARAARRCGYSHAAVTRADFGPLVVALPAPIAPPADDSPFGCVANWFFAHPKLSLSFIGNAAASVPEKPE